MYLILKLKIIGAVIASLVSFPLTFLYKKFPSFFSSIFSPVNNSLWEHGKVIFGSILIGGIIQKIIMLFKKLHINNICFSTFISAIVVVPIYIILASILFSLFGERNIIKILVTFITILIAEIISYFIMKQPEYRLENYTIFFAIITYIIFMFITYFKK